MINWWPFCQTILYWKGVRHYITTIYESVYTLPLLSADVFQPLKLFLHMQLWLWKINGFFWNNMFIVKNKLSWVVAGTKDDSGLYTYTYTPVFQSPHQHLFSWHSDNVSIKFHSTFSKTKSTINKFNQNKIIEATVSHIFWFTHIRFSSRSACT